MNCFTTAGELAEKLVEQKIIAGAGHFYAKYFAEGLKLMESGGYVRIGFVHYNTMDEINRVLTVLVTLVMSRTFVNVATRGAVQVQKA